MEDCNRISSRSRERQFKGCPNNQKGVSKYRLRRNADADKNGLLTLVGAIMELCIGPIAILRVEDTKFG